jgi:hypothetical protein
MDTHRKSIISRSTADIFKFSCCVVIELLNLEDPMRLMQKTYLFPVQIGMPRLQMHQKSVGYMDEVLFPTTDNAVNVQSPDIRCRISITEKIAGLPKLLSS